MSCSKPLQAGPLLIISKSAAISSTSNYPALHNYTRKSNRGFLVFCAFLLTLLVGSSLLRASSYTTPTFNTQLYTKAFTGRSFFSASVQVLQARSAAGADDDDQSVDIVKAGHVYKKDEALYCDRSHYRTDTCVARGDVRVVSGGHGTSGQCQVLVLADAGYERVERVKPYTRKWEESVMSTIAEVKVIRKLVSSRNASMNAILCPSIDERDVKLAGKGCRSRSAHFDPKRKETAIFTQMKQINSRIRKRKSRAERGKNAAELAQDKIKTSMLFASRETEFNSAARSGEESNEMVPICEVQHEVPAILFSTGGYTGNVYHEFNDGLIPLFITSQQYAPPAGQVVLMVLEYHAWWMTKYAEVVAQLTNYTVIDLARDTRVHCFPEVTVGLRIHDELSINSQEQQDHASIEGFQAMLRAAYLLPAKNIKAPPPLAISSKKPKLVIMSRTRSRVLLNQKEVVALAKEIGFAVQVLSPMSSTRMVEIYRALSECDGMLGVHGAAMTHLVFMRPGATFIQVVPLGTDWAAATYYGEPARKLGLNYVEYKVSPRESSLWGQYASDDPVLVNPDSVNSKGWLETKRIYLEAQNVTILRHNMAVILRSVYARAATTAVPLGRAGGRAG